MPLEAALASAALNLKSGAQRPRKTRPQEKQFQFRQQADDISKSIVNNNRSDDSNINIESKKTSPKQVPPSSSNNM
jgi:hypothetical protein